MMPSNRPVIRPVNKDDVIAIKGELYNESFRGIAVELNGETLGIAGVLHTANLQAFSQIKDELKKYPKTLILAAREFRKILDSYEYPVYAHASEKENNSTGYLEYIGFKQHNDKRIYKWQ